MTNNELRGSSGGATTLRRAFRLGRLLLLIGTFVALLFLTVAWGHFPIPSAERTVLLNLYASTNGAGWTNSTDWNGEPGTECYWYGVYCNGDNEYVTGIYLPSNNLTGSLPDLSGLSNLQSVHLNDNNLTGLIPDLSGLSNLTYFWAQNNQLTGPIPSLSGLSKLQIFRVDGNQLTSITSLGGSALTFVAFDNQLTGSIPDLSETNLFSFQVHNNQLTGSIPDLSGHKMVGFNASNNKLTGTIPSLSGLYLRSFDASINQLTGPIPSLSSYSHLEYFDVSGNQLTGPIPSLSSLSNLLHFSVNINQLTGTIPPLSNLSKLQWFGVNNNQLTGPIPSLSSLSSLQNFDVSHNKLTGDVPAVPSPNNLVNGGSQLCPNKLNHTDDPAWDAATGDTPWYQYCEAYSVTYDGNSNTGGSVPVDNNTYTPGEEVTVLGNTGALYRTGYGFLGWNTAADGSGASYVVGSTFTMGSSDVVLYAQWTPFSGFTVRIAETGMGFFDIQTAYYVVQDGQTIKAQQGLGAPWPLLFDNPSHYNPFSITLDGGYDLTFTQQTGMTMVKGSLVISRGSVVINRIVIWP